MSRLVLALRVLVVLEILLGVVVLALYIVTEPLLPAPLLDWVTAEYERPSAFGRGVLLVLGVALVMVLITAWVGLWFLRPFGRWLYVGLYVAGVMMGPFFGPTVAHAAVATVEPLLYVVSGMILSLVYFSPLRRVFARRARLVGGRGFPVRVSPTADPGTG